MGRMKKLLAYLLPALMMMCLFATTSEATVHTLQLKSGKTILAKALVDDTTEFTGMYSFVVDGTERAYQQLFWYRLGPAGKESSLDTLTLKNVVAPDPVVSPNTLSLTYSLPGSFDIKVDYLLTYPGVNGGAATLQKNVTITNVSAGELDYHLFEYSDFELTDLAIQDDSIEMVNNRVYQNGTQADGSSVTLVHQATPSPTKYDLDSNQTFYLPELKDDAPTDIFIPQTPYSYGDDMLFAQQWDFPIPAGNFVSLSISDTIHYAPPVTAAKTHAGSCVTYNGQADYSIAFDNLASTDALTNFKIIDYLPLNTVPGSLSNGGAYDAAAGTVTWNLGSLAAGAGQNSVQLPVTVNSSIDITNEALLVSDQTFPTRVSDFAALCNHPPSMNAVPSMTINEGSPLSYKVVASDPDLHTLTYSLTNAPAGMTISSTGQISWVSSVAGFYTVTATATDSGAGKLSASRTFNLTVKKLNLAPTITSNPTTTATDSQSYSYTVTANDPDGDSIIYALIKAPAGMVLTGNKITWAPVRDQVGTQAVQVMVTDGQGHYVYQDFTITVTHVNNPPLISLATAPLTTATVGSFYSYPVKATDPDGDLLSYSLIANPDPAPAGMTIGTTGVIGWTPTAAQNNKVHQVTAQVSDGLGGIATISYSIIVGVPGTKVTPTITWATPTAITYGTAISATQLNASSGGVAGTFTYSPAAGTVLNAGSQTLSVTFNPTDTVAYNSATQTATLTVNKAAATVTLAGLSQTYDGTAKSATATTSPAGKTVTLTYGGSATAPTAAGSYTVVGTINDANYTGSATGTLVISKATPTITWATPAPIFTGTALSSTQLNATANVPGTYVYTPASGTVMNTAGTQTLSVAFTPTDATNYNAASKTVNITVNTKVTPTITWATPTAITYGTALSATQLNASSGGVAGTFTYSPAAGTVLNAGSQTLSVTFTPTDTTTYNSVSKTVTLTVNKAAASITLSGLTTTYNGSAKAATAATTPAGLPLSITYAGSTTAPTAAGSYAVVATVTDANYTGTANGTLVISKATPTVTWATPTPVFVGTALSATQLNATASVNGSFTYTPASGVVMNAAGTQTLSVAFTPTDATNYTTASATVSLTVNSKQNPTITWNNPTAITYGTALSATQLNATASVAGTFVYTPAIGATLNAGTQTLSVTFNPTNTTTYNSVSKAVTLTVNKAAATVTLSGLTATYNGSAKSATATTSPAGLPVSITYAGSANAPTAAGSYAVVATVTDANYTGTANGTLVISKATPTVTWATPTPVFVGAALSSTQLNATASVPGTFTYTPATGTVMNTTGNQTLSAAFVPTDSANYNSASATVTLAVNNKTVPTITWNNPAAITYGTALSPTQLNASAGGVAGTFTYTPASGTVLNAGTQTLSVTFTPTNTTTYTTATKTVTLTVNKAAATVNLTGLSQTYNGSARTVTTTTTPAGLPVSITYAGSTTAPTAAGSYAIVATVTDGNNTGSTTGTLVVAKAAPVITWATPAPVYVGTALSSTQLNAIANVAGTFTYTPATGTVMSTAGNRTLSVAFTPTNSANYTGATATVSLTVSTKANPTITWNNPAAITYGTALSGSQLNATANVAGNFTYTPALGTILNSGAHTLTAVFNPTDTAAYNSVTTTATLIVNKATAVITLSGLSQTYNGQARTVNATTAADLPVSITYAGSTTAPTAAGSYAVVAIVNESNYAGSTTGTLVVAKATPVTTWPIPSPVYVGTALTATQLNATANVPGTFTYTPAAGTVMNTAGNQTLSAAFAPTDSANYTTASATVSLTVNTKQTPTITWPVPGTITYGTPLSAAQFNVSSGGVEGTFTFSPTLGTVLNVGIHTLTATFSPADTLAYSSVSKSNSLRVVPAQASISLAGLNQTYNGSARTVTATTNPAGLPVSITYAGFATAPTAVGSYPVVATVTDVNYTGSVTGTLNIAKATPVITWASPSPINVGIALSSTQLNATASVPGTFTYTPTSGTVMNTAGTQTLSVAFTPTDATNYTTASATVSLTVNSKQNPTISWNNPAAITYGTALSATQLNASAGGVAGTFAYTPATGAVLNTGSQTLSVTFNPTDTATYNSVSKTVTLTVNKAAATVTLSGLTATYNGSAKAATAATTPAGLPVSITYAGSTTAPTAAGSYAVVATVTDANYTGSATGTLVISKAASTMTWAAPAPITVGTALSATQLNATANVPGTFVYTPVSGTVMNTAGTQTLSVAFTPTDATNYTTASATVALTVNPGVKENPTITWNNPTAITYGTALSATQLNATASVAGTLTYSPAAGTLLNAGSQTLSVTFNPTDTATYNSVSKTVTLTVNKAAASVTLSGLTATYNGSAKAATAGTTPAGLPVSITYAGNTTAPAAAGSYAVVATVTDANYTGTANGTLVISKATPTVTWATPAPITVGTALSATQLNATANAPGTFVYTPVSGTVMNTAGTQTLSVAFTPTDAANYNNASTTTSLTVNSGGNTLNQPPAITSTPLTRAYEEGYYFYQVMATDPNGDPTTYSLTSKPSGMTIDSRTGLISWRPGDDGTYSVSVKATDPAGLYTSQSFRIYVGDKPSSNSSPRINSTAVTTAVVGNLYTYDVNASDYNGDTPYYRLYTSPNGMSIDLITGVITWTPTSSQTGLQPVSVMVVDSKGGRNYQNFSINVAASQNPETPVVTWTSPTAIVYGTALSAAQLNATANVAGTFAYSPASGTVLNTGSQVLSVTFTPTDSITYTSVTKTVSLTVAKATPTVIWSNPAPVQVGTTLSSVQLNATANVAGAFIYTPASGMVMDTVGTQPLSVVFTPTDSINFNNASAAVSLTVSAAQNSVPVFTSASNLPAGDSTQSYSFQVSATDPDLDIITFSLTNAPAGMTIAASGLISWNSPVAGSYRFTITAEDGKGGTTMQDASLYVAGTTVNQPPAITSEPVTVGYRYVAYRYDVQAIDPENQTVKFALVKKPSGMTINSSTGLITWLPTREGSYAITVKATDSKGTFTFQNFTLTVKNRSSWSGSSAKRND